MKKILFLTIMMGAFITKSYAVFLTNDTYIVDKNGCVHADGGTSHAKEAKEKMERTKEKNNAK